MEGMLDSGHLLNQIEYMALTFSAVRPSMRIVSLAGRLRRKEGTARPRSSNFAIVTRVDFLSTITTIESESD